MTIRPLATALSAWGRRWPLMIAFAVVLLPIMIWLSADFGVSWDERQRHAYGERVWDFYHGVHGYEAFPGDRSSLYGALFDLTAVWLEKELPYDPYLLRHALNAVFGWLAIVFSGAIAAHLYDQRAGVLAMVLLVLTPPFFGHAMNNPKDIPFAALATVALYGLIRIRDQYPWLPPTVAVWLSIGIGLSLAVRPGGILFLAYAAVVVPFAIVRARDFAPRHLLITSLVFLLVAWVGMTLPLPWWPWLQTRPYVGLIEAVNGVSKFEWNGTVLFDGSDVRSTKVPWTYLPIWMLFTMTPVVLAGAVLSLVQFAKRSAGRASILGLWLAVLFPIVFVVARRSTLYDGLRHFLFIVPPLVVLAALGWRWLLEATRGRGRLIALSLLLVGVLEAFTFQVRNHPNEAVYFNPILGGPRAALGRFELDYWGNCLCQAMDAARPLADRAGIEVVMSGQRWQMLQMNGARIKGVRAIPPGSDRVHLEVVLLRERRRKVLQYARRPDAVYRVTTADGTPLCVVLPGPAYQELARRLRSKE